MLDNSTNSFGDPNYRYERHAECEESTATYKLYCFKVFSQKWLNESVWYSSVHENSVWWHWMVLVVPRKLSNNMGTKVHSRTLYVLTKKKRKFSGINTAYENTD